MYIFIVSSLLWKAHWWWLCFFFRTTPENKPVKNREITWGWIQIKRRLPGFKTLGWEIIEGIWGTAALQSIRFLSEKERKRKRVKTRGVGRIALWLRVSGALASFPGSAQASRITLAKVTQSPRATALLLLHASPSHSIAPLLPSFASPAESVKSLRCRLPLISDLSLFLLSLVWFVSVCTLSSNLRQSL